MGSISIPWDFIEPLTSTVDGSVDTDALVGGSGLGIQHGNDVSLGDYFRIRAAVASKVEDETCHMSSRQLVPGSTHFVLSHIPAKGTLADIMKVLAEAYNLLHGGKYNRVEVNESSVDFVIDDTSFPYTIEGGPDHQFFVMESTLIYLMGLICLVTPRWACQSLDAVSVKRDQGCSAEHLDFWTVPLIYNSDSYRLRFDRERAQRPFNVPENLPETNHELERRLAEIIDALADGQFGGEGIVAEVETLLAGGETEQESIAALLDMSPATLRRHLSREGENFRDVRKRVLNGKAQTLLRTPAALADIAQDLGFSDVRSFNRAFLQWNGETPYSFRNSIKTHAE